MEAAVLISLAGFILNALVVLIGGVWALSRIEIALRSTIEEHRKEVDDEFATLRREVGETAHAIRTKLTEVALYNRDNYVRRNSFYEVLRRLEEGIKSTSERLEAGQMRMEAHLKGRGPERR